MERARDSAGLFNAKEMLHIFIYDYLRKHHYSRTATVLRQESGIVVNADDEPEDERLGASGTEGKANSEPEDGFLLESWAAFWDLFTERAITHRQTESHTTKILQNALIQPLGHNSYLDMPDTLESPFYTDDMYIEGEPPEIMPPVDESGNIRVPWNTMTGCIAWFLGTTGRPMSERQIRDEIRKIMVFLRKSTGQAYSSNAWRDVRKWLQNGHFAKTADNLWTIAMNHDFCDNCRNRHKKNESDSGELMRCALCPRSYHPGCVGVERTSGGPWSCPRHADLATSNSKLLKRKHPGDEGEDSSGDEPLLSLPPGHLTALQLRPL